MIVTAIDGKPRDINLDNLTAEKLENKKKTPQKEENAPKSNKEKPDNEAAKDSEKQYTVIDVSTLKFYKFDEPGSGKEKQKCVVALDPEKLQAAKMAKKTESFKRKANIAYKVAIGAGVLVILGFAIFIIKKYAID